MDLIILIKLHRRVFSRVLPRSMSRPFVRFRTYVQYSISNTQSSTGSQPGGDGGGGGPALVCWYLLACLLLDSILT